MQSPDQLVVLAIVAVVVTEAVKRALRLRGGSVRLVAVGTATIGQLLVTIGEGLSPGAGVIAAGIVAGITSSGVYEWAKPLIRAVLPEREAPHG